MLKKISCDQFLDHGVIRDPIEFGPGLNTVLGTNTGSNSIGKSTFLMIIDFAFGGVTYTLKALDVQQNIGVHRIKFEFEFEGKPYYFARSTGDTNKVEICDGEEYNATGIMSLEDYRSFLRKMYRLELPGLTFRNAVGRFFRGLDRGIVDAAHPLKFATRETDHTGIEAALMLFDKYQAVHEKALAYQGAKEQYDAYKNAQKYNYIRAVTSQAQYDENEKKINSLELHAQELAVQSSEGLLDLDSEQARLLSEMRQQLSRFKRERVSLQSQLRAMEDDKDFDKVRLVKDYGPLEDFFPGVLNSDRLQELEDFHRQLKEVLQFEFKASSDSTKAMIDLATTRIKEIECRIREIGETPNVTQAVLEEYASVQSELKILREANSNFQKNKGEKEKLDQLKNEFDALVLRVLREIAKTLNKTMAELTAEIYDGMKRTPYINFLDADSYEFDPMEGDGIGSLYKSLIIFDLAMLQETPVPMLSHDSALLKQIEDTALEKTLEIYKKSEKQIFISMDRQDTYSENTKNLLYGNCVLQLSDDEGALFGRKWDKKKK